ncbi:MAG TPA: response regulator [Humidesulfovibrio sp.]|uniref:response regulator n=1 Tax=Humidesulfovibrio sp. TaxID=2910988 RepID=UPI002CA5562E|nr:response regulator [Humidesulfovibrio sp.]HWR03817.1 response regulator [Humidesulfovibrio sp.]
MTKPQILFVDDEQHVLDSLRLLLRPQRAQWDMTFVLGGQAALTLLEKRGFDVVVTDMRMPGVDGAQLLAKVAEDWPEAVRMVLSGYSEQASVMRTVRLAHQYLSKPCPQEELKDAIAKALSLRGLIGSASLKRLICRLDALPSMPPLYRQLMGELNSDNGSLKRVGDIVSQDTGMSSSLLRLVNSSFFGLAAHVSSVHHAVKLLGMETIRVLVLSIELFSSPASLPLPQPLRESLGAHSLRTACFCRAMAEAERADAATRDDCFIAGLLHDLGKLVLGSVLGQEYAAVLAEAQRQDRPVHLAEREAFGATHAEAGAYLLSLWGFKDSITEAVCLHHEPESLACDSVSVRSAVAVANHFDHGLPQTELCRDGCGEMQTNLTREEYASRLREWRSHCEIARDKEGR